MCKIGSDEGRLWLPVLCISFFGLVGKRGVFRGVFDLVPGDGCIVTLDHTFRSCCLLRDGFCMMAVSKGGKGV